MAKPPVKTNSASARSPRRKVAAGSISRALSGPAEAVKAVKRGLPIACVDDLRKSLGVSQQVLGRITNVSERTLVRRKAEGNGRLKTDESERVLRIGLLFNRSVEVLGGNEQARTWLSTPNRALGGQTPLDFADTEPGAREVENLLGRIEHGVFS